MQSETTPNMPALRAGADAAVGVAIPTSDPFFAAMTASIEVTWRAGWRRGDQPAPGASTSAGLESLLRRQISGLIVAP